VTQVAGAYVCAACQRYQKPNQPAPASISDAEHFSQKVQSDVFWIKDGAVKFPIFSNIDMATKYQTATLLRKERTEDFITGMGRTLWSPAKLITDEGRAWSGTKWANGLMLCPLIMKLPLEKPILD
jgi:hypothetical protein